MKISALFFGLAASAATTPASAGHDHDSWIAAESSCTTYEQLLRINYDISGEGATDEDWIALLPSDVGSSSHHVRSYIAHSRSDKEYMWMTTAGDHETFEAVPESHGNIAFQLHDDEDDEGSSSGSESADNDDELNTQYFRLHLIRGRETSSSHHMHVIASSAPIKVSRECPKVCQSWIEVSDTMVIAGEDVGLRVDNCEPAKDDFVALVPAKDASHADSIDPHSPQVWVWACGDRDCKQAVETNGISVSTYVAPGQYVAVLAKRDGTLKAVSPDEIRVDEPTFPDGTPCADTVKVTSSCLSEDDDFTLEISTCLPPREGDWVGVFHHHMDPEKGTAAESHMLAFVYACDELDEDALESHDGGKFTCTKTVSKNKNAMDEATVYKSHGVSWPLAPGSYQVTLVHNRNGISHVATAPSLRHSFDMKKRSDECVESMNRRFLRRNK